MKKLMIVLAAVAMAACSQAANVKWTTDVIYGAKDATGAFATTWFAATEKCSAFSVALTFYTADDTEIDSITSGLSTSTISSKNGKATATTAGYDFLVNTDYKYSAHYEMTYDGKQYTMDVGPTTFTNDKGTGNYTLNVPTGSQWIPVPEPTSGLLLLIGVAGLALRRRRA